jgi:hypothetical protein
VCAEWGVYNLGVVCVCAVCTPEAIARGKVIGSVREGIGWNIRETLEY